MPDTLAPTNRQKPQAERFFGRFLTKRQLMTRRAGLAAVALLTAVGGGLTLTMFLAESNGSPAADPVTGDSVGQVRLLNVEVTPVTRRPPLDLVQTFTGTIQPRRISVLAAKLGGRIESVLVDTGAQVTEGQLLAELDQVQVSAQIDAAQAAIEAAQAQFNELENGPREQDIEQARSRVAEVDASLRLREASFKRVENLFASKSVSRQEFDEAVFSLDAIRAQLRAAKQDLDKLEEGSRSEQIAASRATVENLSAQLRVLQSDLRERQVLAPFAGQIQSRFADEGTIAAPGQQILQIVESAPFEVRVSLPAGNAACFDSESITVKQGKKTLDASLVRRAPALNEATQTREVVLELSLDSSHQVALGSAVTVSTRRVQQSSGFWIPTSSLTAGSRGLWAIYVAVPQEPLSGGSGEENSSSVLDSKNVDGAAALIERRQVELLRGGETWSEVQGTISPGDLLVASGTHRIIPGQSVKCKVAPQAKPLD